MSVEISEAKVGSEFREELVIGSDMKEVLKMTKDELKGYAYSRFGFKLDLSKRIKILRLQVITLIKQKLKIQDKPKEEEKPDNKTAVNGKRPKLLLHTGNKKVFEWTELLAKRPDMIPCDEKGKKI